VTLVINVIYDEVAIENIPHRTSCYSFCVAKKIYAQFHELWLNLRIAIPRSEDIPRFILGLSFCILSTFSNLGITKLWIYQLSV